MSILSIKSKNIKKYELINTPPEGIEYVLPQSLDAVAGILSTKDSVLNVLGDIEIFINFLNWLVPAFLVVVFFLYLIRWAISSDKSESQKIAAGGVWRSFIALFLCMNIWSVMRLLMAITDVSIFGAYWIFVLSFALLFFWSFLNFGDNIVSIFSQIFNNTLDYLVLRIQAKIGQNPSSNSMGLRSAFFLKFIIVVIFGVLITVLSTFLF